MRFFHFRPDPTSRFGGTTIGYERIDTTGNKFVVSFARCSERDVWDRKKSLKICTGRMNVGKCEIVVKPATMDKYEFFCQLVQEHDKKIKEAYGHKKEI